GGALRDRGAAASRPLAAAWIQPGGAAGRGAPQAHGAAGVQRRTRTYAFYTAAGRPRPAAALRERERRIRLARSWSRRRIDPAGGRRRHHRRDPERLRKCLARGRIGACNWGLNREG